MWRVHMSPPTAGPVGPGSPTPRRLSPSRKEEAMAGGSMTILVPNYKMLPQVAQRVLCWAGGVGGADTRRVQIVTVTPGPAAIRIPEEIFAAHGALVLEPGGADILSGYVVGSNATFSAI